MPCVFKKSGDVCINQEEVLKSRMDVLYIRMVSLWFLRKQFLLKRGDAIVTWEITLGGAAFSGVPPRRVVARPNEQGDPKTSPPSLSPYRGRWHSAVDFILTSSVLSAFSFQ